MDYLENLKNKIFNECGGDIYCGPNHQIYQKIYIAAVTLFCEIREMARDKNTTLVSILPAYLAIHYIYDELQTLSLPKEKLQNVINRFKELNLPLNILQDFDTIMKKHVKL